MICQRYGPGRNAARQLDEPFSLAAGLSGSDTYSEKELVENTLGEMRFILNSKGRSDVPVTAIAMHFYTPDNGDTNPCDRIGSNGILAQWQYVDQINQAGSFSSTLRPSLSFDPVEIQNGDGTPWRMPAVAQGVDVISDGCHLGSTYVTTKLMPAFKTGLLNIN